MAKKPKSEATAQRDTSLGDKSGDKSLEDKSKIGYVLLMGCRCRCGHEWLPRESGQDPKEKPRVCPKCKSANWDRPKKWERS